MRPSLSGMHGRQAEEVPGVRGKRSGARAGQDALELPRRAAGQTTTFPDQMRLIRITGLHRQHRR